MAGRPARNGGFQRRGGGVGGGRARAVANPRLAQHRQQAAGQQHAGMDMILRHQNQLQGLLEQHRQAAAAAQQQHHVPQVQQQVQQADNSWMAAPQWRSGGGWAQKGGTPGLTHGLPNWMAMSGLAQGQQHLLPGGAGFGAAKPGGELDGYGMLQTQQVEIDGKLHTMFCVPSDSPSRTRARGSLAQSLGFPALDANAAAAPSRMLPDRGILGGGPVDARWAPMSPRRSPPPRLLPMSPRRSPSPRRNHHRAPSLSPPRNPYQFRGRSPPRSRGNVNPSLLHRLEQGLLPRSQQPGILSRPAAPVLGLGYDAHLLGNPLGGNHLLSQQLFAPMSPMREPMSPRHDLMLLRHNAAGLGLGLGMGLGRGDMVSPTGRDYSQKRNRFAEPVRGGRGILGPGRRTAVPRERERDKRRERERERERDLDLDRSRDRGRGRQRSKHKLPLEQAIAAKRSKIAEDNLILFEEREKTEEFQEKVTKSHAHYTRVLKEDTIRRKKYEDAKNGQRKDVECLVCGSKSDLTGLVTHTIQSTDVRKRADHQGFHRALCELLGWNSLANPKSKRSVLPASNSKDKNGSDMIVWPPTVIVENTRTKKTNDGRWVGMTNKDMTAFLKELGHPHGRSRPVWDREGHRGFMLVEYQANADGFKEAERLHKHFEANGRGRKEWERVQPFWESSLEDDNAEEGPEFARVDETTEEKTKVFYGYLALGSDIDKFGNGKWRNRWKTISREEIGKPKSS